MKEKPEHQDPGLEWADLGCTTIPGNTQPVETLQELLAELKRWDVQTQDEVCAVIMTRGTIQHLQETGQVITDRDSLSTPVTGLPVYIIPILDVKRPIYVKRKDMKRFFYGSE